MAYRFTRTSSQPVDGDTSLWKVEQKGVLLVGSDIPYGSMELFDQFGNPAGVDVDIAKEIAKAIGVKLEFKDYDWPKLLPAVKSGEVDLSLSAFTITEERQKEILFSAPYFIGGQAIVINSGDALILSPNDIAGKKIGAQVDTTGYELAKKYASEKLITAYQNVDDALRALREHRIGFLIVDYIEAKSIVKRDSSFKISGDPVTQEFYGVATKLGNTALIDKVNEVLRAMKRDGRLDQIRNKWI